jgi:predicted MFS family arabinose efflux permease
VQRLDRRGGLSSACLSSDNGCFSAYHIVRGHGMRRDVLVGFASNHFDIAPKHADVLYSISNTFGTIPGIIGVAATGMLLDLTGGYTATFILAAAVNVVGALVWLVWGTGERILE